jgi:hypothetical protein
MNVFYRIETQKKPSKKCYRTNLPDRAHNILLYKQGFSLFVPIKSKNQSLNCLKGIFRILSVQLRVFLVAIKSNYFSRVIQHNGSIR